MNAIATARPSASATAETAALYEGAARQMALHLLAKHVPTSTSAAVAVVRAAGEIYASFITAAAPSCRPGSTAPPRKGARRS